MKTDEKLYHILNIGFNRGKQITGLSSLRV